ncbi:hypothetical protein ACS6YR_04815 [Streptococcus suis]
MINLRVISSLSSYISDSSVRFDKEPENKDQFGEYLEQAKGLLSGSEGVNGLLDKVKDLF